MFKFIKNLFVRIFKINTKNKTVWYEYASLDDLDFIFQCIKSGAEENHFKNLQRKDINLMIANGKNMPGCILKIIKYNNIDVGFLYAGLTTMTYDRKIILQCYEINLLYIIDDYRQMGIATKTIRDLEQKYKGFGINEIYVRCERNNSKDAMALFQKLGYVYFGVNDNKESNLNYNIYKNNIL